MSTNLPSGAAKWSPRARWLQRLPANAQHALFVFVNGFVSVASLAGLALALHSPFVFPSVGPTAFLLYFLPLAPAAWPRNVLYGHAIGIVCGYLSLWLTGLEHSADILTVGVDPARVIAAGLSLAATGAAMVLLRAVHPPAGATTLIISLGFITAPVQLCGMEAAIAVMVLQALAVNRLAGIPYPLWSRS